LSEIPNLVRARHGRASAATGHAPVTPSRRWAVAAAVAGLFAVGVAPTASANEELVRLSKDDKQWVMQGKDYDHSHYSGLNQINRKNVKDLKAVWTFSTGVLHGHEGGPLVVGGIMYVHTPYPNITYAIDLDNPHKILWEHKPKQDASVRAVACCDVVNRGLAYGDGKIFKTQLDGTVVALDAKTGAEVWKMENSDPSVGSTLTQAPLVVEDLLVVGSSGAELGVRGYVTAYRMKDGEQVWRAYATGPDEELLLADDFNTTNPHYGQKGLGTSTWEGDAWKIGGGTNWGWYAYDPALKQIYYGSGNPAPWNETMRPGDNKWTMAIWSRDAKTGKAKFAFQKTPHDEWDYAGVNWIGLSEMEIDGKKQKILTLPA